LGRGQAVIYGKYGLIYDPTKGDWISSPSRWQSVGKTLGDIIEGSQ